jgi:hypothetical protein
MKNVIDWTCSSGILRRLKDSMRDHAFLGLVLGRMCENNVTKTEMDN